MMEELLKAILQGADGSSMPQQQRGQDPLADLIGSVLGGGSQAPTQPQQLPAGDPLAELIKGVLGGEPSAPQQAMGSGNPIIDILGSVLGGGRPGGQNNSFLEPIASALADKLGISPQIALIVINLAMMLLLNRQKDQGGMPMPSGSGGYRRGGTQPQDGGLDLDDLLDENYLQATGATAQLSRQTGMSEADATRSLQEAFTLLNNQTKAVARRKANDSDLKHLLDTWED